MKLRHILISGLIPLSLLACAPMQTQSSEMMMKSELSGPFQTATSDGVTIYGDPYFGDLTSSAPLILLFHQGGSNARGEYGTIAPWLNENGFRVIAWDQRSGGETYGSENRTALGLQDGVAVGYCDAMPDLQAALDFVIVQGLAESATVWGSSYSGALVFGLAAANPDTVNRVMAFSPASGGPMVDCRARMWADGLSMPMFATKPTSEMERESSQEQQKLLTAAGVEFIVIEDGIHGSSMLVDERTEHDMSAARQMVLDWLNK